MGVATKFMASKGQYKYESYQRELSSLRAIRKYSMWQLQTETTRIKTFQDKFWGKLSANPLGSTTGN
jgi:hypothetical protein